MKRKRHGTDEIIRKLRESEAMEASGQTMGQICRWLPKVKVAAAAAHATTPLTPD